jgi:hypothetical protein
VIRLPRKTDQGYIASSWAKSILRGTHAWERHGLARSGHQLHKLIDTVLDRADTRALVRVKPSDPDTIYAWLLYAEGEGPGVPVVHYVYARADEREKGYAGELLYRIGVRRDSGVVCTSDGPASAMMRSLYPAAVHVPLATFLKPNGV